MSFSIFRFHHLTGRAVDLTDTDVVWKGLANGEIDRAVGNISRGIALRHEAFVFCKSYIPEFAPISCREESILLAKIAS